MGLFKADLYRSFAIGFVLGAAMLAAVMGSRGEQPAVGGLIPAATAAPAQLDQTLIAPEAR